VTPVIPCAICGEPHTNEDGWFLLTENRWTDRIRVLVYDPVLATQEGIVCSCSRAHVRELVVHWMITGRLDYPFALAPTVPLDDSPNRDFTETRPVEVDVRGSRIVGELAVHRESLTRILLENPQSLSGVLEALIAALGGSSPVSRPPQVQGQEEETEELALTHA
jgi:hypothetical protein